LESYRSDFKQGTEFSEVIIFDTKPSGELRLTPPNNLDGYGSSKGSSLTFLQQDEKKILSLCDTFSSRQNVFHPQKSSFHFVP
jgi:hypothetical protein